MEGRGTRPGPPGRVRAPLGWGPRGGRAPQEVNPRLLSRSVFFSAAVQIEFVAPRRLAFVFAFCLRRLLSRFVFFGGRRKVAQRFQRRDRVPRRAILLGYQLEVRPMGSSP